MVLVVEKGRQSDEAFNRLCCFVSPSLSFPSLLFDCRPFFFHSSSPSSQRRIPLPSTFTLRNHLTYPPYIPTALQVVSCLQKQAHYRPGPIFKYHHHQVWPPWLCLQCRSRDSPSSTTKYPGGGQVAPTHARFWVLGFGFNGQQSSAFFLNLLGGGFD